MANTDAALKDPVRLELLWRGLVSTTDEAAWTLTRTSFSAIVREAWDFGVLLYDTRGRIVAQNMTVAGKIGLWHTTVEGILARHPVQGLRPGDMFISNDPWLSNGHLYDTSIVKPAFDGDRLLGYIECIEHLSDVGGSISSAPRDLLEEGLVIPPTRIVRAGKEVDDVVGLICANTRTAEQNLGDLRSMMSAAEVCNARLIEWLRRFELGGLDELGAAIIDRSATAMRSAIREAIPNGTYEGEARGDGATEPLAIKVRVAVDDGTVELDFTGTSDQQEVGVNSPWNFSYAWAAYAIHCLATPDAPLNHGWFAPIKMHAPVGSIINATRGAPVRSRSASALLIPDAVFAALSGAVDHGIVAGSSTPTWVERVSRPGVSQTLLGNGGMGARIGLDGLSAMPFPNNASNTPVEVIEELLPLRVECRSLRADSGGPGKWRGGLGQEQTFLVRDSLNWIFQDDHTLVPAAGLFGGEPGALGEALVNGEPVEAKSHRILQPGDRVTLRLPGGGGMFRPGERSLESVAQDLLNGYVSGEAAVLNYDVVLDKANQVDFEASAARRKAAQS